jgi:hypothetical protein
MWEKTYKNGFICVVSREMNHTYIHINVSFVFGYLTCPHCRDPFFIFTIVMFMGGVGDSSHTPMISFS